MILKFDNNTIQVPTSWADVRLGEYERWFMTEPKDQMEYVQFVSDICQIDAELLLGAPTEVFNTVVDALSFISQQEFDPQNYVEIDGEKYFVSFSDDLTLAEWVDVESVLEGEGTTKISEVLAILCRPADERYNTKTAEARKEVFRNLRCDKVLPLIAFFLFKKTQSEKITHLYSTVMDQTDLLLRDINHFAESGGGTKSLPIWQRIKYYYLIKYLKKQLSKYSDSCSTRPTKPQQKKSNLNFFSK